MAFEFMGMSEFATMTGRHRTTVRKMIVSGVLVDCGYRVISIPPKNGRRKTGRWAIGVPVAEIYCCPDCGKQWEDEGKIACECPSCGSKNVERHRKVA